MSPLAYPEPELSDGVIRLRPWNGDDLACIEEAATDPRIPEGTTVPARFSVAAGRAFVERQHGRLTSGQGVSLAITDSASARAVGLVILTMRPQPGVGGIGYWLVPSARGHGRAGRAADLVTRWGLEHLHLARVEAWAEPENVASHRTLEAAGFQREGVLRDFLALGDRRADAVVFSRLARDR